jgi:hypothetical protein
MKSVGTLVPWRILIFLFVSFMLSPCSKSQSIQTSCKNFVQSFYEWYVANYDKPAGWLAVLLKEKSSAFSPKLLAALREYGEAPENSGDQISGLDFDPILNAQDNADKYVVEHVIRKGNTYWVEVYGILGGKKRAKPDVVPELMLREGRWVFVNFHYEQRRSDLLTLLAKLQEKGRRRSE